MGVYQTICRLALLLAGTLFVSCSESLHSETEVESAATGRGEAMVEGTHEAAALAPPPLSRAGRPDTPSSALALHLAYPVTYRPQPTAVSPPVATLEPEEPTRAEKRRAARRSKKTSATTDTLRVRTTAYCRDEGDHFTFGSMSAIGKPLRLGTVRSAAADWSRFPAGTQFRIEGDNAIYEIDDYGSALVGSDTIDLYQPDEIAMEEWGVRHVDIEILRWGSRSRSLDILRSRAGTPHIDAMIRSFERGDGRGGFAHGG